MIISIEKILFSTLESIFLLKLFDSFLIKKNNHKYTIFALLLLISVSIITPTLILSDDILKIIYSIIIFSTIAIFSYKGKLIKKICASFMLYTIVISIKTLSRRLIFIFFLNNYILKQSIQIFFESITSFLILIVVYHILSKIIPSFSDILSNKIWFILSLISSTVFISIVSNFLLFSGHKDTGNITLKNNFYVILLIILYLTGILSIFYLVKILSNIERLSASNKILNIQLESSKYIEENQLSINKVLHDTRNHLAVVNSYLYDEDLTKAKSYLDKVILDLSKIKQKRYCENFIVNSIINIKMISILKSGIKPIIDISLPKKLKIANHDLSTIFCNTIDNSIEACNKISDNKLKIIKIKSVIEKDYFVYKIENSKNNDIKETKKNFLTNKKDRLFHGYGLGLIKSTVDKYNGNINIHYDEKYFSILIIISYQSK